MVNDNNGSTRSAINNNKKSANDTKSSSATTSSSTQSADKDKHDAKQVSVCYHRRDNLSWSLS